MYVGAVVSALSLVSAILTVKSLRSAITKRNPSFTQTQIHSAEVAVVVFTIILGLVGIGLWIWMARMNQAGKNWARITATVFFGLNTLGLLVSLRQAEAPLSRLISLVVWLVGLAAVIMLWRKESSQYFAAQQQP
jgi:hypothetical protein